MGHSCCRLRCCLAIAAAALPLSVAGRASAANVTWRAPSSCSESRSLVEQAERLLGRPLDSVDSVDFEIAVHEHDDGRWTVSLDAVERFTGERRRRELSGLSCAEVTDMAAVAVAMTVESGESTGTTTKAPDDGAPQQKPSRSSTATARPGAPPEKNRVKAPRRFGFSLNAAAAADAGALPNVAPGFDVGASLGHRSVRLTAFGEMFVSQTRDSGGKGGDFELLVGGFLACGVGKLSHLGILGCLGAEGGRLSGTGVGVRTAKSGESPWWAPRADVGVLVPLGARFSLLARLAATLPRVRREFVLDETTSVHQPAVATGRALVGIEIGLE